MFKDVDVVKKANVYEGGNVTSRTILFKDGKRATLGIMLPGAYEFNTKDKEKMEILSGKASVLVKGEKDWNTYTAGDTFEVQENSSFKIEVKELLDYCCYYG